MITAILYILVYLVITALTTAIQDRNNMLDLEGEPRIAALLACLLWPIIAVFLLLDLLTRGFRYILNKLFPEK